MTQSQEISQDTFTSQQAAWDQFSPGWDKWFEVIVASTSMVTDAMIEAARIEPGSRVLDAAGGSGEPGITLAARMPECIVVATDISEEMVHIANRHAHDRNLKNYAAQVARTSELPFDDKSFDAALCRFGIMFSPNPADDVREMSRVVKSGGRVVVATWKGPEENPWAVLVPFTARKYIEVTLPSPEEPGIFRFADPDALKTLFEDVGLTEIEVEEVAGAMMLDSPENYWSYVTETAPPIAKALSAADAETREKIRAEVLNTVREQYMHEGSVAVPWKALVAHGTVA